MALRTPFFVSLMRALRPIAWPCFMLLLAATLVACGGTSLRSEPLPTVEADVIGSTADSHISVSLQTLIVRNGPGSWATNADWDEYELVVANLSGAPIWIEELEILDALDQPVAAHSSRKELVRSSRSIARRHDDAGIDVKAGAHNGVLLGSGAAMTALGVGTASAAGTGALVSGGSVAAGAATAASGFVLAGTALIATGIVRSVNNVKVNDQIEERHTNLPLEIPANSQVSIRVFFPIVPSPRELVLGYRSDVLEKSIAIDTSSALEGLHIESSAVER